MQLFNKKLLAQKITRYEFPANDKLETYQKLVSGWQKALKDSDLDKTKETGIQGQFLAKFFENILGYSTQTTGYDEWNLIQEPKTEMDSKEADGALGFFTRDNKRIEVVIELKDAKTSLDKKQAGRINKVTPVEQAFGYLNKFDRCKWAIVSNFREIRLYSKTRGMGFYEHFEIMDLHQELEFKRFYFLLNKQNLIADGSESIVEELVKDTTAQEENITKQFYAHYKEIRLKVYKHLLENNPDVKNLILLEKTQKLLDRLIFTLVCEDTSTLLPANIIKQTHERALSSFSSSDERVWSEFRGLFHAIDNGNSRVNPPINAYNGGLFKVDQELDGLIVKDSIWDEIVSLTKYDFASDLNVNVLGHIFEQSISDLEELKSQVDEVEFNKKKSLRKKQGIFYTPEYITKFIVENTVGKYLEEHPGKLSTIKILDPACGSGAFLNQAHSFLFNEYAIRAEQARLEKQQKGEALTLWDANQATSDRSILLNNLFGVDLSPESVEIAKLALWLKTARASEKLQNLDNNIKCGNSLISDPVIAGNRAFDWNDEFPDIIKDGGFDVIIGNPPYIYLRNDNMTTIESDYMRSKYELYKLKPRTDIYFLEKAFSLLRDGGLFAFIVPNNILTIGSLGNFRNFLLEHFSDISIVNIKDKVFTDANVDTMIIVAKKTSASTDLVAYEMTDESPREISRVNQAAYIKGNSIINYELYNNPFKKQIVDKIEACGLPITEYAEISNGLVAYKQNNGTPKQTVEMIKNRVYHTHTRSDDSWLRYVGSSDARRYQYNWSGEYIQYGENLGEPRTTSLFDNEHLIIRVIPSKPPYCINCTVIPGRNINDQNYIVAYGFPNKIKMYYVCAILNSSAISFWFVNKFGKMQRGLFPQLKAGELATFPIPKASSEQEHKLASLAAEVISQTKEFSSEKERMLDIFTTKMHVNKNAALSSFFELGWNELVAELEKQKVRVPIREQDDLNQWFIDARKKLQTMKADILDKEHEIDDLTCQLFGIDRKDVEL